MKEQREKAWNDYYDGEATHEQCFKAGYDAKKGLDKEKLIKFLKSRFCDVELMSKIKNGEFDLLNMEELKEKWLSQNLGEAASILIYDLCIRAFDYGVKAERERVKKELLDLANNYIGDVLVEHLEDLFSKEPQQEVER